MKHFVSVLCFLGWCFAFGNLQSLQDIPGTLSNLAANLQYHSDIQNDVYRLAHYGNEIFFSFYRAIKTEGSKILTEYNRLEETSDQMNVNLNALIKALKNARTSLQSKKSDIESLELDIKSIVGKCHFKRVFTDAKIYAVNSTEILISQKISTLGENIKSHYDIWRYLKHTVDEIESKPLRKTIIRQMKRIMLALSTDNFDILFDTEANDADVSCVRRIKHDAESMLQQAQNLTVELNTLKAEKINLDFEIRQLQRRSDELEQAEKGLEVVSGYLLSPTVVINDLLLYIENMETSLYDAVLHKNSFEIMQNAFSRYPEKLEKSSQAYLDNITAKWLLLAKELMGFGAKFVLT